MVNLAASFPEVQLRLSPIGWLFFKLTYWVCGTNPSALGRGRDLAHKIGENRRNQTESDGVVRGV